MHCQQMDPSSRFDSSSAAAGQSPRGWSFVGHASRSSENPLYNSVGSLGTINVPPQVVYEELPPDRQQMPSPANQKIRPRDYLEPQVSSVRTERTVTNNALYASVGANQTLPPRSNLNEVYQFAPIERAYDEKQLVKCSCGWGEAAILSIAVLVILLSAASLIMVAMLLAGVVSLDRPVPSQSPPTITTDPAVVSPVTQTQRDLMALRNDIEIINSRVNRITNQTAEARSAFQSRLSSVQSQLAAFNQSIQSDTARSILFEKANTSINTEQACVVVESEVCSGTLTGPGACSGGQEEVVNSNLEVLTEFSCFLNSTVGPINGSAALQLVTSQTIRSGTFTVSEIKAVKFFQGCYCFLLDMHPANVQCVRRSVRCSSSLPNLSLNVVV